MVCKSADSHKCTLTQASGDVVIRGTVTIISQGTHDALITSLLRQNDVVTLFRYNDDVITASRVRWDPEKNNINEMNF